MEVGTEKCLLSRVCSKLTAYPLQGIMHLCGAFQSDEQEYVFIPATQRMGMKEYYVE